MGETVMQPSTTVPGATTGPVTNQSLRAATVTVTVRYFAAARAASGVDEEQISAHATVAGVLDAAVTEHGVELERVLTRCSYLRNAVAVHGVDTELADGDRLDVLPPFAGG